MKPTKSIPRRLLCLLLGILLVAASLPVSSAAVVDRAVVRMYQEGYSWKNTVELYNPVDGSSHTMEAGKPLTRIYINESNAYCIQPGVHIEKGSPYEGDIDSEYWNYLDRDVQKAVGLVLYYGFPDGRFDDWYWYDSYYPTQIILWEFILGFRDPVTMERTSAELFDNIIYKGEFVRDYEYISEKLMGHSKVPSFTGRVPSRAPVVELQYNKESGLFEATLTDDNALLPDFYFPHGSIEGVTFTQMDDRTLKLTADRPIGEAETVSFTKALPDTLIGSVLVWTSGENQELITGANVPDPVQGYLKIKTETTGSVRIVKESPDDGVVAGRAFRISGNGIEQDVVTGEDGSITAPGLTPGVYTVEEIDLPAEYIEPKSQTVSVVPGETATVTFTNRILQGDVVLEKTEEGNLLTGLPGAVYGVYKDDGSGEKVASITTGEDGSVRLKLRYGSYYLIEEQAPHGYVISSQKYFFRITQNGQVETVEATDKRQKGRLVVTKHDAETGDTPQGDATLDGAEFDVIEKANGRTVAHLTAAGQTAQSGDVLEIETPYLLQETKAPTGYNLQTEPIEFQVAYAGQEVKVSVHEETFADTVVKGRVSLRKYGWTPELDPDALTPQAGIRFTVTLDSDPAVRATITTDENGDAVTPLLPYGIYTVHEEASAEGYLPIADFQVKIDEEGKTYHYDLKNDQITGQLKVIKLDAETGKPAVMSAAGFQIRDAAGALVVQKDAQGNSVDTFYTSEEGTLLLPQVLPYGKYELIEVKAPTGYTVNPHPVPFEVKTDNELITLTMRNSPVLGTVSLTKLGESFVGADKTTGVFGDVYTPLYEARGQTGAVFEIRAAADVVTGDGTVRYQAGQVVDTVTTGEDGTVTSQPLYIGTDGSSFEVREIKAPEGFVLNSDIYTVRLTYEDQDTELVTASQTIQNDRQKAAIDLKKSLEQNDLFGIGQGQEYVNIKFGLFAAETLSSGGEAVIPKDGLIEVIGIDGALTGSFSADLPHGKYYVREVNTDPHYSIDPTRYPIDFRYAGQETETVTIHVNNGQAIENRLQYGRIEGSKVDDDGFGRAGALIGLFRKGETVFTKETALLVTESNEIGYFQFEEIPVGEYLVRELRPPDGLLPTDASIPVTIRKNGQTAAVEITNTIIRGSVQATKVDAEFTDVKLSGAEFCAYADVNDNGKYDAGIDKLAGVLIETEEGVYRLDNLPYGPYLLKETKAPEGFLVDDAYYPFEIVHHDEVVPVENGAGFGQGVFADQPILGELILIKRDAELSNVLPGAGLLVRNAVGEVVSRAVANEEGIAIFKNLRAGKYTYEEYEAPKGYQLDATRHTFEIKENGEVIQEDILNERIPAAISTGDEDITSSVLLILLLAGFALLFLKVARRGRKEI